MSFGKNTFDLNRPNATLRDSNMELLRILCMFMIVLRHFIIHPMGGNTRIGNSFLVGQSLDALCYVAVNCFILLSGWFGITFKWKKLLSLFFMCSFYGLISYLFYIVYGGFSVDCTLLYVTLMPFSHSCWWFINAYVFLFFCAPLINLAINNAKGNEDFFILLLLTIVNVYFGNIMQTPLFNDEGYNGQQMVYMYWIGGVLRKRVSLRGVSNGKRAGWLFGYFALTAALLICRYFKYSYGLEFIHLGYNNIMTIGASVFFFLFVGSFQFQSKTVNFVSVSALAVYLIQESQYFGREWLYPMVGSLFEKYSLSQQLALVFAVSIMFFALCVLIDQVRKLLSNMLFAFIEKIPVLKMK